MTITTTPSQAPEETLRTAEEWLDRALDAARRSDERLVLAALRLLCLRAREDHPGATTIELEWSDQGDFLSVCEVGSDGASIEWEDEWSLAVNFAGHCERYWAPFMTTNAPGSRFYLDITNTIAAIGAAEASDLATRVDTVLDHPADQHRHDQPDPRHPPTAPDRQP